MIILKQSTAVTLLLGPFLDETDGKTAETGLTIAQADVRLSKNGGNMAQKNESTSCTHDEIGYYTCPLDTTDTGTLGQLKIMVHESGALPVWVDCLVVTANVYDTLFSTDQLDVNVTNIEGSDATNQIRDAVVDDSTRIDASALNTLSGHDPGENIMGATDLSTEMGRIDASVSSRSSHAAADVWSVASRSLTTFGSLVSDIATAVWGAVARTLTAGTKDDEIDAILTDTGTTLPAQISGLNDPAASAIADAVWDEAKSGHTGAGSFGEEVQAHALSTEISALNDVSTAEVNAACDTAISDAALATAAALATVDANVDAILEDTGTTIPAALDALSTFDPEADELENSQSYAAILRVMAAILAGDQASGAFRDLADTKNRAVFTIDSEAETRTRTAMDGS